MHVLVVSWLNGLELSNSRAGEGLSFACVVATGKRSQARRQCSGGQGKRVSRGEQEDDGAPGPAQEKYPGHHR